MTTTGVSVGTSLGKSPRVTNIGFNQEDRDKQGVTRNTVVGNVEIGEASGSPINRDVTKANEVTRDEHHSTNINVESQTIEYATNPAKLKEDLNKAKDEIKDITKALDNSIHDPGDDNRNFFGQLRETRLSETVNNIAGERLKRADNSEDVVSAWKDAYKDLGYNLDVKYTTGEDTPEMKNKAGTAYVSKDGVHTIIININAEENSTKAGLIGTLAEEASHIVNGVAGRQIATGTEEKGLESTGRAANAYFQEEYKGSNQNMTYKSDGKIDTSKLGTHVGDDALKFKLNGNITVAGFTPDITGSISIVRNDSKKKIWVIYDIKGDVKLERSLAGASLNLGVSYYPGVITIQELDEPRRRTKETQALTDTILTYGLKTFTGNPYAKASGGIYIGKGGKKTMEIGLTAGVGITAGKENPILPKELILSVKDELTKVLESTIKEQLKLSKVVKIPGGRIIKEYTPKDLQYKALNILPNPSGVWRSLVWD